MKKFWYTKQWPKRGRTRAGADGVTEMKHLTLGDVSANWTVQSHYAMPLFFEILFLLKLENLIWKIKTMIFPEHREMCHIISGKRIPFIIIFII